MIVYTHYLCDALRLKCSFIIIHFHWLKTFSLRNIRSFCTNLPTIFGVCVLRTLHRLCSSSKNPYPPRNFHSKGCFSYPPPPPRSPSPGISVIFQLGWYPLERLFAAKMLLHYIIDTCFETSVTVK